MLWAIISPRSPLRCRKTATAYATKNRRKLKERLARLLRCSFNWHSVSSLAVEIVTSPLSMNLRTRFADCSLQTHACWIRICIIA